MIDYEELILIRQEMNEIMDDEGYAFENEEITEIYNPILLRMLKEGGR